MKYITILTILTVAIGWIIVHQFTSIRDLKNFRRNSRIDALTNYYMALIRSGLDGPMLKLDSDGKLVNNAISVENAIALIHLHGNEQQSELANAYVKQIEKDGSGDLTKLIDTLRKDIRTMLGSRDLVSIPHYLRVKSKEII